MKLLVCGGRDYDNYNAFLSAMDQLPFRPSIIIEGGAKGADRMGRRWAIQNGVHYATVPALWAVYDNAAGPKRNSAMLILNPDYCLAMPGGTGTADMVKQCQRFGVVVWEPYKLTTTSQ